MNKVEEIRGVKIHGIVTLCVSALLALINLTVCPQFLWFFFPLAGMSLGLVLHWFLAARKTNN